MSQTHVSAPRHWLASSTNVMFNCAIKNNRQKLDLFLSASN